MLFQPFVCILGRTTLFPDAGRTTLFPDARKTTLFPDAGRTTLFPDAGRIILFLDARRTTLFPDAGRTKLFPVSQCKMDHYLPSIALNLPLPSPKSRSCNHAETRWGAKRAFFDKNNAMTSLPAGKMRRAAP